VIAPQTCSACRRLWDKDIRATREALAGERAFPPFADAMEFVPSVELDPARVADEETGSRFVRALARTRATRAASPDRVSAQVGMTRISIFR
jgi:hypothetical protein